MACLKRGKLFFPFLIVATSFTVAGMGQELVEGKLGTMIEIPRDPQAMHHLRSVEDTLSLLNRRGWRVQNLRIRLTKDPFDATVAGADIVLPLSLPVEDKIFALIEGVVKKNIEADELKETVAGLVAAHLAPPTSQLRQAWERAWQQRVLAGELQRTALLELLWRLGDDQTLQRRSSFSEVWQFLNQKMQNERLEEALWDLVAAGLVAPEKLGFTVGPASLQGIEQAADSAFFRLATPQLRWLAVTGEGEGLGLWLGRLIHASVRVLVVYSDGRFDIRSLTPAQELRVPREGVKNVVVGVMSQPGEAIASLTVRDIEDYPVRLGLVEMTQEANNWQIAWDVEEQTDVRAYVVEVWEVSPEGESLQVRELIPTVETGPVQLFWAREVGDGPSQIRVFALTRAGLLAKLFSSPLLGEAPSHREPDYDPEYGASKEKR